MMHKIFIIFLFCFSTLCIFDIESFGAIPNSDTLASQFKNKKAIQAAIIAANQSQTQKYVKIPPNKTFYTMPILLYNLKNITFNIFGKISASKNVKYWPKDPISKKHLNFMDFKNCTDIEFNGGGKIDGRGYHWWMLNFLNDQKYLNNDDRPMLFHMDFSHFIKIHDLTFKNSPNWNIKLDHCYDVTIYNVDIKTNTTAQINLLKKLNLQGLIPMFPFNTDGIDPSGARYHIFNLTVQNYDDVVVPKPGPDSDCTRDILVENVTVKLGVGMSIGTVPPRTDGSCIKNVTFKNVVMKRPFKAIYLKTNPGNNGHGTIEDIHFKNFIMDRPIWWAIYLGPQQMKQPSGKGPGCMLYPFDPKGTCATQPRVSINNINLQNIRIHESLLYPVTIRCNVSNPCTNINFKNVKTDGWRIGQKLTGNVCEFASGTTSDSYPVLSCLNDMQKGLRSENKLSRRPLALMSILNKGLMRELILKRIIKQTIEGIEEVGYWDDEDDDFTYEMEVFKNEQNQQIINEEQFIDI